MAASEHDLELTIDTIPAQAWSTGPDGSADVFNQHYLDFVGLSAEQAAGWGWTVALHPDDRAGLATTCQRILAAGEPSEAEARLRRHDGVYRWFLFRANSLRDDGGRIVEWHGVNTDIEDRKRTAESLRTSGEFLLDVQRLTQTTGRRLDVATGRVDTYPEVMKAFAAEPSDDVTVPSSFFGRIHPDDRARVEGEFRRCRRERVTDREAYRLALPDGSVRFQHSTGHPVINDAGDVVEFVGARETARRTIRDGNRAADVITWLRALFGKKEFSLEPFELNEVTREVIALSSNELQRNRVVLEADLAGELPNVTGDRVQLQQVILNLLRNASDAMAGIEDRPRDLLVRTEREDGGRVRVSVRDAGIGIDRESANKLFDAFYTTKRDGMGVGLSVSRSIVERHHGRLWVEPNGGPGATFAFSIPGASAPAIDTKV